ncbi:MAG: hypothetical protein ACJAWV_002842 [Flammeovirgaceae bacterium]|jgi:hypothetical protein
MDSNLQIIRSLESFIDQAATQKTKYYTRLEGFSRTRILGFKQVCYFILNLSKRSLCLELNVFFEVSTQTAKSPVNLPLARPATRPSQYFSRLKDLFAPADTGTRPFC